MGWTAPRRHQTCQDGCCQKPHLKGKPSMGKCTTGFSSVTRVGLDLAKNVFQVHGVDGKGEVAITRKLRRGRLVAFFCELPACVVAMEACSSAHHWARALIGLGHEVKLI